MVEMADIWEMENIEPRETYSVPLNNKQGNVTMADIWAIDPIPEPEPVFETESEPIDIDLELAKGIGLKRLRELKAHWAMTGENKTDNIKTRKKGSYGITSDSFEMSPYIMPN